MSTGAGDAGAGARATSAAAPLTTNKTARLPAANHNTLFQRRFITRFLKRVNAPCHNNSEVFYPHYAAIGGGSVEGFRFGTGGGVRICCRMMAARLAVVVWVAGGCVGGAGG